MSRHPRHRICAAAVIGFVVAAALTACSTQVEVRTDATGVATPTSAPPTEADDRSGAATSPPVDTDGDPGANGPEDSDGSEPDGTTPDGTTPDGSEPDGSEPDTAAPLHTPARGEPVAVVGVAFDEVVVVRAAARPAASIVTELPALFDEVLGTGQGRTTRSIGWWRVRAGQDQGWVDASSMARLGATTDVTADVRATLGRTPAAPTMRALGRVVAQARLGDATEEPEARIVLSAAPTPGDLAEVVYDIVGRSDASVAGERLVVFATTAAGGDGFVLRSVEATTFCVRGVTADGRCT